MGEELSESVPEAEIESGTTSTSASADSREARSKNALKKEAKLCKKEEEKKRDEEEKKKKDKIDTKKKKRKKKRASGAVAVDAPGQGANGKVAHPIGILLQNGKEHEEEGDLDLDGAAALEGRAWEQSIHCPYFKSDVNVGNDGSFKSQTSTEVHIATGCIENPHEDYKSFSGHSDNFGGLEHILDLIISLDTQEVFIDPVDELFAPNYSKVIKFPMCFKKMKEKVQTHQYVTWQAFVDDFERICYNAMKYNQNRSNIWRAAKKLLGEGKKLLENFKRNFKPTENVRVADEYKHRTTTPKSPNSKELQIPSVEKDEAANGCHLISQYHEATRLLNQPTVVNIIEHRREDEMVTDKYVSSKVSSEIFEDPRLDHCTYLSKREDRKVNVQVNIDSEEAETEDSILQRSVQDESDSQATEGSSSFGCSLGESEMGRGLTRLRESGEVQSRLKKSSENALSPDDDALVGERNERKKALKQEWKSFRRGIEWRCRWLEIRVKALQEQASRYDEFIKETYLQKPWRPENGWSTMLASRTVPFANKQMKQHVLLRKRRRKLEESIDPASFMSRHPLFSRYEKKRQEQDDPHEGISDSHQSHPQEHPSKDLKEILQPDESDLDESPSLMNWTTLGENSIEELWWNFESLQVRVVKLRYQLIRRALIYSNDVPSRSVWQGLEAINIGPALEAQGGNSSSPSSKGIIRPPKRRSDACLNEGSSKLAPSSLLARKSANSAKVRRRTADYDISNVVMPVSVGAKYVEPVRHAKIETPGWRRMNISVADTKSEGMSSEEDTDDELYMKMHCEMEVKEKLHRMPLSLKQHLDEGSSTMCRVVNARGKVTTMDFVDLDSRSEDPDDNSAPELDVACSGSLIKGKRSRRDSRGTFSHSRGRQLSNLFSEKKSSKS